MLIFKSFNRLLGCFYPYKGFTHINALKPSVEGAVTFYAAEVSVSQVLCTLPGKHLVLHECPWNRSPFCELQSVSSSVKWASQ